MLIHNLAPVRFAKINMHITSSSMPTPTINSIIKLCIKQNNHKIINNFCTLNEDLERYHGDTFMPNFIGFDNFNFILPKKRILS